MLFGWASVGVVVIGFGADPVVASTAVAADAVEVAPPAAEVVRIKRDFGKAWFDLAIDAWTDGADKLEKVRLLWVNTGEDDRRKPLGKMIERMVSLQYKRLSRRSFTVTVAGDGKEFMFTVELAKDGALHTYVAVDSDEGVHVPRCRTEAAKLHARRVIGIPVGIARVAVTCKDALGAVHTGQVKHRAV